jgi:hypothetical protein
MQQTIARLEAQLDDDDDDTASHHWIPLHRVIAAALASEELRVPTFCLVAKKVLQRRLADHDDEAIAQWLVERVGIGPEHTRTILGMATDAGHAAADIEDGAAFDAVVERMVAHSGAEPRFVTAMVQMAIDLMEAEAARLDRRDLVAGLMTQVGIDDATIDGAMRIVHDVLRLHALGAAELAESLAGSTGMDAATAHAFVEQTLTAAAAARRIREGEDVREVFVELGLDRSSPQVMIIALRLVDEPAVSLSPGGQE